MGQPTPLRFLQRVGFPTSERRKTLTSFLLPVPTSAIPESMPKLPTLCKLREGWATRARKCGHAATLYGLQPRVISSITSQR